MWPTARTRVATARACAVLSTTFNRSHPTRRWREMDSNFRFRTKGATDLSFRFCLCPETVRVLTQRSTLLGAGGSKSRSRQANGANSRSLESVLASAARPDGASGNRQFESISLQRRVSLSRDFIFVGQEPRLSARVCRAAFPARSTETPGGPPTSRQDAD